jgi:Heterokaryon incompatibility protein (HET)
MADPSALDKLTGLSLSDEAPETPAPPVDISTLPDFEYSPLQFDGLFRLIDLHYGAPSDDLMCTLYVGKLGRKPFSAISYCWGAPDRTHLIKCGNPQQKEVDGVTYQKPAKEPVGVIKITENLKNLLLAMRTEDTYVTLWIDSICINQADVDEKSAQVKMMNLIYENAYSTIVYLGESDRETEAAMEFAKKLAAMKDWPTEKVPQFLEGERHPIDPPLVGNQGEPQPFLDGWIAFTRLLDRNWFRRVWVIQELVLSSVVGVNCGGHWIRWDIIADACQVVLRNDMYDLDHMRQRCGIVLTLDRRRRGYIAVRQQMRERDGNIDLNTMPEFAIDMNLATLQMWTRHCGASDPRDKVLALRNICIPSVSDILPPIDYSMSVSEVYVRAARYWFMSQPTRPLQILTCVDNSIDAEDLPSWCPDWRKKWKRAPLGNVKNKGSARDIPAVATFPEIPVPFKLPLHLTVRGFYLMTIKEVEKMKIPRGWENARHSAMIEQFTGTYPTTIHGYHEAFLKAVNPQVPEDFNGPGVRPYT